MDILGTILGLVFAVIAVHLFGSLIDDIIYTLYHVFFD